MLVRMSSCLRVSLHLSACLNLQTLSFSTCSSSVSSSLPSFFKITNHRSLLRGMLTPSPHRASFQTSSSSSSDDPRKEILVQHLLVKQEDLSLLFDLQQRIARGEDLSDLAAEYSICPSKQDGGMLGWVRKGQMVPEFEETAFSASLNKVVKCKTKFGWHLLQVLSEREKPVLENIQCKELHMKMQDPSFLDEAQLIDVREPEEVYDLSPFVPAACYLFLYINFILFFHVFKWI